MGLLFFGTKPEAFFPYAQINVVEFLDGEGGDTLVDHTFKGPLDLPPGGGINKTTGTRPVVC